MNITRKIKTLFLILKIKLFERRFEGKLPYLYVDNHADSIIIVFSAFTGKKRRYNFVKGFEPLRMDKLYILDPFGYLGSYNLYEHGSNYPEVLTRKLIEYILGRKPYKQVYCAGSSKGGTCAIYYGLEYHADVIFSGACQYNLGSYLHRPDHEKIFETMASSNGCGDFDKEEWNRKLNSIMPSVIEKNRDSKSEVHVIYSKKELTYQRQIIDLLEKLHQCHIPTKDIEMQFEKHEEVGKPFIQYVLSYFNV